ncbi:MAG TPA: hypothetical protein VLJ39_14535 [Tepidisphaeraceae bacterium]|nr:hypothetical protein [Tepidisphaeraceae bacterium]
MKGPEQPESSTRLPEPSPRHAGWAALVGVLGIALIMIGVILVAMLDAPVVRHRIVITGFVLVFCGLLLLPVAWFGRHRHKP